jgi:hypothetical protein
MHTGQRRRQPVDKFGCWWGGDSYDSNDSEEYLVSEECVVLDVDECSSELFLDEIEFNHDDGSVKVISFDNWEQAVNIAAKDVYSEFLKQKKRFCLRFDKPTISKYGPTEGHFYSNPKPYNVPTLSSMCASKLASMATVFESIYTDETKKISKKIRKSIEKAVKNKEIEMDSQHLMETDVEKRKMLVGDRIQMIRSFKKIDIRSITSMFGSTISHFPENIKSEYSKALKYFDVFGKCSECLEKPSSMILIPLGKQAWFHNGIGRPQASIAGYYLKPLYLSKKSSNFETGRPKLICNLCAHNAHVKLSKPRATDTSTLHAIEQFVLSNSRVVSTTKRPMVGKSRHKSKRLKSVAFVPFLEDISGQFEAPLLDFSFLQQKNLADFKYGVKPIEL